MKRFVWIAVAALIMGAIALSMRPRAVEVTLGRAERRTVCEYVADEAKTRLAQEYIVDLPVSGTVERIQWEVGDVLQKDEVIARVETFGLEQKLKSIDAQIAQVRARMQGVDVEKPKPEDLQSAATRAQEMADTMRIAEKELNIARTEQENARRDFERAKSLLEQGVSSQWEFDQADRRHTLAQQQAARGELALQAARKGVDIAELASKRLSGSIDDNEYMRAAMKAEAEALDAQRAIAQDDLGKAIIRAPAAGPILEKYVDSRRVLPMGSPLVKMGDIGTIEIECDVLSEEVVRVKPGARAEISGKAISAGTIPGKVKRIYPSAFMKISALGIEQQRVKTILEFDNAQLQLRPGTRLDVRIITAEREDTLAVPERATFREEGAWYIFAVQNGHAVKTPVTLGLKNDEWAEVLEGLEPDAAIVSDPTNELAGGRRVREKSR